MLSPNLSFVVFHLFHRMRLLLTTMIQVWKFESILLNIRGLGLEEDLIKHFMKD